MLWFDLYDVLKIDKIINGIRNLGNSFLVEGEIDLNMLKVLVYIIKLYSVLVAQIFIFMKNLFSELLRYMHHFKEC